jgi:Dockerin type I domain
MNRIRTRLMLRSLEDRTVPSISPVGGEFRLNTFTTNAQYTPKVAMDQVGDFVAVWDSGGQDGSGFGIYGQRYSSTGVPQGVEFRVNTYTTNEQNNAVVAMDQAGDFVVAWTSKLQDVLGYGTYARRYNSAGVAQGAEFRANTYTIGNQVSPAVAMDQNGDFVVAWLSGGQDGSDYGVFAQRYNAAGATQGTEFRVNTYTSGRQIAARVAMDQTGNFVVAWESDTQDGGTAGVYAKRYNAAGVAQGGEFRVNTYTTGTQGVPALAMDQTGDFVVAWYSDAQDGSSYGIYAQRFNSSGSPQGGEFRVNTFTTSQQLNPAVAMDQAGDFVVAWQSLNQDGSGIGVYAQTYQAGGAPSGSEFLVNSYTNSAQNFPALAMDVAGDFVAAWQSNGQDGSSYGAYAQRYRVAPPSVSDIQVNDGTAQRSRVTSLTVTFSAQVTFASAPGVAFTLDRNSDAAAIGFTVTPSVIGGVTVATLTNFTGAATEFGSLADGRYTLTALASQISSGGVALDGNGDGIVGDDYILVGAPGVGPNLFRFYGDIDGDGAVGANDFAVFRQYFNSYLFALDFDGDGSVSTSDFVQFRQRFGGSI